MDTFLQIYKDPPHTLWPHVLSQQVSWNALKSNLLSSQNTCYRVLCTCMCVCVCVCVCVLIHMMHNVRHQNCIQSNLPTTGLREAVRLSTTAKLDGMESLPIPAIRLETPRSGWLSTPNNGQNLRPQTARLALYFLQPAAKSNHTQ